MFRIDGQTVKSKEELLSPPDQFVIGTEKVFHFVEQRRILMKASGTRWSRVRAAKAFVIFQLTIDRLVAERGEMNRLRLISTLKLLVVQLEDGILPEIRRSFIGSSETIDDSISGLTDRQAGEFRCLIDQDARMMEFGALRWETIRFVLPVLTWPESIAATESVVTRPMFTFGFIRR